MAALCEAWRDKHARNDSTACRRLRADVSDTADGSAFRIRVKRRLLRYDLARIFFCRADAAEVR